MPRLRYVSGTISIHALREEGDLAANYVQASAYKFLSTPSARRATSGDRLFDHAGEISIHALREEGDERGRSR